MSPRRRSMHFVPGGNDRFFSKALDSEADTLVLDLEDSVPPHLKVDAREAVVAWLGDCRDAASELMVRINATDTDWWPDDLAAVVAAGAISVMVPKVGGTAELDELDAAVRDTDDTSAVTFFPVATETAQGVFAVPDIAAHHRVDGVCWGAEDLSAVLGAARARDNQGRFLGVFDTVRSLCLLGASAGGVGAVDAVWTDLADLDGLRRESVAGAEMGFDGKITIHPAQIEIVNAAFTPSDAAVADALELLDAFDRNGADGRYSFTFRGGMVDAPHRARAERLLRRAGVER